MKYLPHLTWVLPFATVCVCVCEWCKCRMRSTQLPIAYQLAQRKITTDYLFLLIYHDTDLLHAQTYNNHLSFLLLSCFKDLQILVQGIAIHKHHVLCLGQLWIQFLSELFCMLAQCVLFRCRTGSWQCAESQTSRTGYHFS